MTTNADTGNSATLVLGTTGAVGNVRSIGEISQDLEKLETSYLATSTFKTYMPSDLAEPGEVEFEVEFDTSIDLPACGVVETITITYPMRTGETVAANHAGTGFILKVTMPSLENGAIQVAKVLVAFDGETGPAFTKST